jgi:hypothetical protein
VVLGYGNTGFEVRRRLSGWPRMWPGSSMVWGWVRCIWSGRRWAGSSRRPSRWSTPIGFG